MPWPRRRTPAFPLAAARGALVRIARDTLDFAGRVYHKAGQDDVFFLAGGIAFNILLGAVPFLFLLIAIFGWVLRTTVADPEQAVLEYIFANLPASRDLRQFISTGVDQLLAESNQFGVVSALLLVWVSTRLIGSLRSALRSIFDIQEDRGIIGGKIFDAQMVLVAGTLFVANTGITVALEAAQTYGIELLNLRATDGTVRTLRAMYAQLLAYAFIFSMFALIYRYLPARRISWRIALVGAAFSSVTFEMLKSAFAWYVAYVASFGTTYGALETIVVLAFWIYYSAVVFVMGGEVGQVYGLHRIRRRQRELLD